MNTLLLDRLAARLGIKPASRKNKIMAFADKDNPSANTKQISPASAQKQEGKPAIGPALDTLEEATALGRAIFATRKAMKALLDKLESQKKNIAPHIKNKPLVMDEGTIVYVEGGESYVLNKAKIKQLMMDNLRISPEIADKIISSGSTKKFIQSYIKIIPNKLSRLSENPPPAPSQGEVKAFADIDTVNDKITAFAKEYHDVGKKTSKLIPISSNNSPADIAKRMTELNTDMAEIRNIEETNKATLNIIYKDLKMELETYKNDLENSIKDVKKQTEENKKQDAMDIAKMRIDAADKRAQESKTFQTEKMKEGQKHQEEMEATKQANLKELVKQKAMARKNTIDELNEEGVLPIQYIVEESTKYSGLKEGEFYAHIKNLAEIYKKINERMFKGVKFPSRDEIERLEKSENPEDKKKYQSILDAQKFDTERLESATRRVFRNPTQYEKNIEDEVLKYKTIKQRRDQYESQKNKIFEKAYRKYEKEHGEVPQSVQDSIWQQIDNNEKVNRYRESDEFIRKTEDEVVEIDKQLQELYRKSGLGDVPKSSAQAQEVGTTGTAARNIISTESRKLPEQKRILLETEKGRTRKTDDTVLPSASPALSNSEINRLRNSIKSEENRFARARKADKQKIQEKLDAMKQIYDLEMRKRNMNSAVPLPSPDDLARNARSKMEVDSKRNELKTALAKEKIDFTNDDFAASLNIHSPEEMQHYVAQRKAGIEVPGKTQVAKKTMTDDRLIGMIGQQMFDKHGKQIQDMFDSGNVSDAYKSINQIRANSSLTLPGEQMVAEKQTQNIQNQIATGQQNTKQMQQEQIAAQQDQAEKARQLESKAAQIKAQYVINGRDVIAEVNAVLSNPNMNVAQKFESLDSLEKDYIAQKQQQQQQQQEVASNIKPPEKTQ